MATSAQKMFYAMLGGVQATAPSADCGPYTMPPYTAADVYLDKPMLYLANAAMNIKLCEEFVP